MITAPRYEIREALVDNGIGRGIIFDTFAQDWCKTEGPFRLKADAMRAVTRLNSAYVRAMSDD